MNFNTPLNHFRHPKSIKLEGNTEHTSGIKQHRQNQFNPYELNGGNVIGVVNGKSVIVAGDTRLSRDFSILKRNASKIHRLTEDTYILSAGAWADITNLWKELDQKIELYELNHQETMSAAAIASLVSRQLYSRRFFPYYVFNLVVGFDKDGNAQMWNYDAVGSYELKKQSAQGLSANFMEPLLDNQLEGYNNVEKPGVRTDDQVRDFVVDAFQNCAERDITTGDGLEVKILKKGGPVFEKLYPLRGD